MMLVECKENLICRNVQPCQTPRLLILCLRQLNPGAALSRSSMISRGGPRQRRTCGATGGFCPWFHLALWLASSGERLQWVRKLPKSNRRLESSIVSDVCPLDSCVIGQIKNRL
ncbi:uncharacterized protein BO72DRAFT_30183 [Aspergillus fijiensis CBS 313.89]|uniref:Uncharacterized protein n=1 Tax=Aspergillus fijiensis CBS 313.89 TaxID=1448319 RepID=A0A8G1VTF8_9EURO|nr:uncharacterized protein BO72DRAFT_30183 [Aspergillus fijiensis CBS 313.89]RAK71041.1 hypothetical protein BO72DRAFT_30183 [Aspergillus fijiensis CBS 313.89]